MVPTPMLCAYGYLKLQTCSVHLQARRWVEHGLTFAAKRLIFPCSDEVGYLLYREFVL